LRLRVYPRSRVNQLEDLHGEALKLRLQAPPVDGKANAALLKLLSSWLRVPQRDLCLTAGETSRSKTVSITGLSRDEVCERLLRGN
jgi:hypothetical protein